MADTLFQHPSPNFGDRRDGRVPDLIVLHYTAMASAEAALERLSDPAFEVSSHYLIGRDGRIWQLVPEEKRAWHAGAGSWLGQGDVNSRSVGIELDNDGKTPFGEPLMAALEGLLPDIMDRWSIGVSGVIGHSDIAPARKSDPGRRFDWRRLARSGLAFWPDVEPASSLEVGGDNWAGFLDALAASGFPTDPAPDALLEAFRARFRPHARGPLTQADVLFALHLANDRALDLKEPLS
ncbi:MAG: N-acetylmuramoyl-L-alanine amidase [Pseudomonadota bacterium]